MAHYQTSIIIPLFNQWELTRNCLKSLAATLDSDAVEIIAVDNGSTDITPKGCPILGHELFGSRFRYIRSEKNINFGPASNLGAESSNADYLIFLNNDTVLTEGWYEPLLQDFLDYPNLGATGPLLLYPPAAPLGFTVQHLGVYVSPTMKVGHLYEGLPACSPLAGKRRFFQIITAACMMIPRWLFLKLGKFDPNYRNGFEDVDLCAKMHEAGYFLTVNPKARVIHYQGQSEGRHEGESHNSLYFQNHALHLLSPDWHQLVVADDLIPGINPWLDLRPFEPTREYAQEQMTEKRAGDLLGCLLHRPFDDQLWHKFAEQFAGHEKLVVLTSIFKLLGGAGTALEGYETARSARLSKATQLWFNTITYYCRSASFYKKLAISRQKECQCANLPEMAECFNRWVINSDEFEQHPYARFMKKLWTLLLQTAYPLYPSQNWAYNVWLAHMESLESRSLQEAGPTIAIVLERREEQPELIVNSLRSLARQTCKNWKIILTGTSNQATEATGQSDQESSCLPAEIDEKMVCKDFSFALDQDYVLFLEAGDQLPPHSLSSWVEAIRKYPQAQFLYSDEDCILPDGTVGYPYFKQEWSAEWIDQFKPVGRSILFKSGRLKEIGWKISYNDPPPLKNFIYGLRKEEVIHIPKILLHVFTRKAPSLDYNVPRSITGEKGGIASTPPMITLIMDISPAQREAMQERFLAQDLSTLELLFIDKEIDEDMLPDVKLGDRVSRLTRAQRINEAAQAARGEIIGFILEPVFPLNPDWMGIILTLWQISEAGAFAGPVFWKEALTDAGWIITQQSALGPIGTGVIGNDQCLSCLGPYPRMIAASNGLALFTPKKIWLELDGFRPELQNGYIEDYCLRLNESGHVVIWDPSLAFRLLYPRNEKIQPVIQELNKYWAGKLPPTYGNLDAKNGRLILSYNAYLKI